jgi:CP family cyanate transporter-like MFS transporter
VTIVAMLGIIIAADLAYLWIAMIGLALSAIFPLVLTLPIDVSDDPAQVGSVAALMLLGGYIIASTGPFALGAARDLTGDFATSLWLLVAVGIAFATLTTLLSRRRLHRGIPAVAPPG